MEIILLLLLLLIANISSQSPQCSNYVDQLIKNISKLNIQKLPLQSIMYSGLTANNPGQKYQCEKNNYTYFLVNIQNKTTNIETFTGLCVPPQCDKKDIESGLAFLSCQVYDYPKDDDSLNAITIAAFVIVGLWLLILILHSVYLSIKEPTMNQNLKKSAESQSSNMLNPSKYDNSVAQDDFKMFNFYEGYCKIFRLSKKINILSSIQFLAVFSYIFSTQFSYRQTISSNPTKAMSFLSSFWGIFVCNIQIASSVIMFILGFKLAYNIFKFTKFRQIGRYFFDKLLKKWLVLIFISLTMYAIMSFISTPLSTIWNLNYGQDCSDYLWQWWFLFRSLQLDCKACLPWLWILESEILLTLFASFLIVIFRVKKWLGYFLLFAFIFTSLIVSFAILESQSILFEPLKLFNMQKQFTFNYQTNPLVRAAPFFLGLTLGLVIVEGLVKIQGQADTIEHKIARKIRHNNILQFILHFFGFLLMITMYCLMNNFLQTPKPDQDQTGSYIFIVLVPFSFIIGLWLFMLPSFLQCDGKLATIINSVFGWTRWDSLDKMSITIFLLGPMVIGFTTYCMQNNIYYDLENLITYFVGDFTIIFILAILFQASIENQIEACSKWAQTKFFGQENKYSVIIIQE